MKVNYKELDFDNFVQIFNTEGIEAAKAFVARVETLTGVPVNIVAVGPGREQTIIRDHII